MRSIRYWVTLVEAEIINFGRAKDRLRQLPTSQGHVSMVILQRGEPEWDRAWEWLQKIEASAWGYDIFAIDGEQWQYMGTDWTPAGQAEARQQQIMSVADGIIGEGYYHNFRIRWHPVLHNRIYRLIPSSKGWKPSYENVLAAKDLLAAMKTQVSKLAQDHPELLGPKTD